MMRLALATLLASLLSFVTAQEASCGLAFRVTDAETRQPIPAAAVAFLPYRLVGQSDLRGFCTWNLPNSRDNFFPQGREFEVAAWAPGYELARRTFRTPPPVRGTCGSCDDGVSLFSFEVPLVPVARIGWQLKTRPTEATPGSGYYDYRFTGTREKACCEGPSVMCVDVVNGQPLATVDYTDKNKKTEKTSASVDFKFGGAKKTLLALGFCLEGESSAEKVLEIDAKIGDRTLDPTLCGSICIRKIVTEFLFEKWWVIDGRAYSHGTTAVDVVTGVCVSGANLRKCTEVGTFDSCGRKTK